MRNSIRRHSLRPAALGLALALAASFALPLTAQANDQRYGNVRIDRAGVHFDFGPGHFYRVADYPHASWHFASNKHYRKAQKYQRRRQQWTRRLHHALERGDYQQARHALDQIVHFDRRRQRQLARLDADRVHFEQRHEHRSRPARHRRRDRSRDRH